MIHNMFYIRDFEKIGGTYEVLNTFKETKKYAMKRCKLTLQDFSSEFDVRFYHTGRAVIYECYDKDNKKTDGQDNEIVLAMISYGCDVSFGGVEDEQFEKREALYALYNMLCILLIVCSGIGIYFFFAKHALFYLGIPILSILLYIGLRQSLLKKIHGILE